MSRDFVGYFRFRRVWEQLPRLKIKEIIMEMLEKLSNDYIRRGYKGKLWWYFCQMTKSRTAYCDLTEKPSNILPEILLGVLFSWMWATSLRENKGNYGYISVKWLNPELHIVIWRKNHCTSIAGNAAGICIILDVNHFPAWKKGKL